VPASKLDKIIQNDREYLYQNYGERQQVCFTRGSGAYLYDQDGKEYVDFFTGIAVSNLGYGNPALQKALHGQVDAILHSSNHYYNLQQINAARLVSELSFPGKTLFANSGTEANEAAIKLARRYGMSLDAERYEILSFTNSFHGRTMGAMTATAQKKIHEGFGPLPRGFKYLPYNDIEAFAREVKKNRNIAAVILELIQGEGGIITVEKSFVKEVFSLCKKYGILTIIDEVQTGIGRTGTPFAFQQYDIIPDVVTMAKGLGGGVPIGAMHTKNFLVEHLSKGLHGSTFGGNHLACAAAEAVLKEIKKPKVLNNVKKASQYIVTRLADIQKKTDIIKDIRGLGLHIGFELTIPGAGLVKKALQRGLVINCTSEKVIRIMPALTIPMPVVKAGMNILEKIIMEEGKAQ
jgi:predicted acetylornithine/succinylornithine family transaminase